MKKIISMITATVMLFTCVLTVSSASMKPGTSTAKDIKITKPSEIGC